MKQLLWISGISTFLILIIFSSGCSNEVDLHGTGEPVPVVYCLLNPLDQNQYIRIGKSFILSKDHLSSGPSADSIIWPDEALVYLERWEDNDPVETIMFEHSEIVEKDTGYFSNEALMIYQAQFQPNPGEEYHLYVYFPELDKIVSGQTMVMSVPKVLDPEVIPGRTVSFDTISPYTVRWRGGSFTGLYQGVFRMHYTESLQGDFEHRSCNFVTPIYQKQGVGDLYEGKLNGLNFLQSVAQQLEPVPGIQREIISFEFLFYAAGPDLAVLIDSDLNGGNPFTIIRNNSNISGGMGVFSSQTCQRFPNLVPSNTTKYFLATSQYTKNLGFKSEGI